MNEHDHDLVRLFAGIEAPAASDEFATKLRQRLHRKRFWAKARAIGYLAALALLVMATAILIPLETLYPLRFAFDFLKTPTGMVASFAFAIGLATWLKLADA
jgi:hypothetical protein